MLTQAGVSGDKLVHTKIRETFERAFWDSLIEDLTCTPPSFAPVLNVLSEIKTGIEVSRRCRILSASCWRVRAAL